MAGSWKTGASPWTCASAGRASVTSWPCTAMVPESEPSTPVRILTRVDLPAPFAPSSAWHLSGRDRQVDRAEGDDRPEGLGDAVRLEQGCRHEMRWKRRAVMVVPGVRDARHHPVLGGGTLSPGRHSPGPLQAKSCSGV